MTRRPAVFLDRDGTLIRDVEYLGDPAGVALLDGVSNALRRLAHAGLPLVVVTNQSGIARGMFTEADYARVAAHLDATLAPHGVTFLDVLHCPHHPDFTGPCECRKPGTLLFRQASERHGLDPAASWYVGDRWRDVAPGLELGGHPILVPGAATPDDDLARAKAEPRVRVAASLGDAVESILAGAG